MLSKTLMMPWRRNFEKNQKLRSSHTLCTDRCKCIFFFFLSATKFQRVWEKNTKTHPGGGCKRNKNSQSKFSCCSWCSQTATLIQLLKVCENFLSRWLLLPLGSQKNSPYWSWWWWCHFFFHGVRCHYWPCNWYSIINNNSSCSSCTPSSEIFWAFQHHPHSTWGVKTPTIDHHAMQLVSWSSRINGWN